jgi:hypothetical protein
MKEFSVTMYFLTDSTDELFLDEAILSKDFLKSSFDLVTCLSSLSLSCENYSTRLVASLSLIPIGDDGSSNF